MSPFLNECNGKISMYSIETAHLLPCVVQIFISDSENNGLTALLVLRHKALSSDAIKMEQPFLKNISRIRRIPQSFTFLCCYMNVQTLGVNPSMFC